jgi:hypothetical protein
VQRLLVLREREPVQVFNLTAAEAISFLVVIFLDSLTIYFMSTGLVAKTSEYSTFSTISLALAVCGFIICINYPRRPDITFEGQPVDPASTVSAFGKFTYSWPAPLLAEAKRLKDLEYKDIPVLNARDRTNELTATFKENLGNTGSMLKAVLLSHRSTFTWQHIFTVLDAMLIVAPQFVMYKLLRLLEARDAGANITAASRFWVVALGVVIVASAFANNQMWLLW